MDLSFKNVLPPSVKPSLIILKLTCRRKVRVTHKFTEYRILYHAVNKGEIQTFMILLRTSTKMYTIIAHFLSLFMLECYFKIKLVRNGAWWALMRGTVSHDASGPAAWEGKRSCCSSSDSPFNRYFFLRMNAFTLQSPRSASAGEHPAWSSTYPNSSPCVLRAGCCPGFHLSNSESFLRLRVSPEECLRDESSYNNLSTPVPFHYTQCSKKKRWGGKLHIYVISKTGF